MTHVPLVPGRRAKRGRPIDVDRVATNKARKKKKSGGGGKRGGPARPLRKASRRRPLEPPVRSVTFRLLQVMHTAAVIFLVLHYLGTARQTISIEGVMVGVMAIVTHIWMYARHYREFFDGVQQMGLAIAHASIVTKLAIAQWSLNNRERVLRLEQALPGLMTRAFRRLRRRLKNLLGRKKG